MKPYKTIKTPMQLAQQVYLMGDTFQYSVSSWGRTPHRNKLVGGSKTSQHLIWGAFDVIPDDMARDAQHIKRHFERLGCWVQPLNETTPKGYIHIQLARTSINAGDYV